MAKLPRKKGFVIYENKNIVSIATMNSQNIKTGNMVQIWILVKNMAPGAAADIGADNLVCGNCKHRPQNLGICYVTLFQGPSNVWKSFHKGNYPKLSPKDYGAIFHGRSVRFGAYGDPAFIPIAKLRAIAAVSNGFTGYTHQWLTCPREYRELVMASVDSIGEYWRAKKFGYRTFRISATGNDNLPSEISCPAGQGKTHCIDCKLCCGTRRRAKDITIKVHGARARKFAA